MKLKFLKSIIISPFIGITALVLTFPIIQAVLGQESYIEEFTLFQNNYFATIMNYTLFTTLTIIWIQIFFYFLRKMFEKLIKKITIMKCILFEIYFFTVPLLTLPLSYLIEKFFPISKILTIMYFLVAVSILFIYSLIWSIKISIEEKQLKEINKKIQSNESK